MTPRPRARTRIAAIGLVLGTIGMVALPGCDPRVLLYFLQPFEPTIPAPGPSLKGKKVVVLTQSAGVSPDHASADQELTREFVTILRQKIKKVEIVDPRKVLTWQESNPKWTDPGDAAKFFDADVVIYLEMRQFQIEDARSPGLLEGHSETHIQVFERAHPKNVKGKPDTDQPKVTEKIYEETWKTVFPSRGPISMDSGVTRPVFRSKFMKLVSSELSWQFVEHAPGDDIQDVKFNTR